MAHQLNQRGVHWAAINEVSFVAGMRLLFWISRVAGRWPFRVVLYPVLTWYVLTKPLARRASRAYLDRVRRRAGPVPGVLRHFAAFGESILDKMLLWGGLFKLDGVDLHGAGLIAEAAAAGRGGLLICAHLGNLELTRVLSRQRDDIKLTVLVHTKHAQAFNAMLARLNPASELNLLQVTEMSPATAIMLSERVARGEFVVIAGDRIPVARQPRVAVADFLGAPAAFPVGPYVLANILQCPVFLLFSIRRGERSEVHFERFRDQVRIPRQGRDAAMQALAADYARRLEHYTLQAPLQWFNFYDFWHLPEQDRSDASG
jgi:predicted LPLAT superfamily acyltransferase